MGRGRFPGLDGLRFYAALGVAIMHAEQAASIFGVANVYSLIYTLGDTCVSAFFVLSGFLITFLLLDEFESGGVGLLNFSMRVARCAFGRSILRSFSSLFLSCQQSRLCRFRVTIQPGRQAGGKVFRCI